MKNLLAIDTSTQACSVAIAKKGSVVSSRFVIDRQAHSQQLLGMIQSALTEVSMSMTELDAVVCSYGPGTFTGVRIGVGVAKGLAYGQDLPILSVSSLSAMALTAVDQIDMPLDDKTLLAINDARMNELYSARYQFKQDKLTLVGDEALLTVDSLPLDDHTIVVGTGIAEYQAELAKRIEGFQIGKNADANIIDYPTASAILKGILDNRIDVSTTTAEDLRPNYLRNKMV